MNKAKNFTADLFSGERFELESLKGNKIWLAFFRYASCPLCNLRVHDIILRKQEFEQLNIKIVAVFQSDVENTANYVGKQELHFPLICDPKQELYKLYGVGSKFSGLVSADAVVKLTKAVSKGYLPGMPKGDMARIPADFLIDEQMNIVEEFHGKDIGDHIPFETVIKFAKNTANV